MDLAREPTSAKYEPWLPAHHRQEIGALQTFHHKAGAAVHYDLLIGLWYVQTRRTRSLESGDLVRHMLYWPAGSQQLEHATVLPLEDLSFGTLANEAQLTPRGHLLFGSHRPLHGGRSPASSIRQIRFRVRPVIGRPPALPASPSCVGCFRRALLNNLGRPPFIPALVRDHRGGADLWVIAERVPYIELGGMCVVVALVSIKKATRLDPALVFKG
jgi:hypothetical protein